MISLYFHIPFCTKKCHYCHFFVLPDRPEFHQQLLDGLSLEISQWASELKGKQLASIYFGGGTPSLLSPSAISFLIEEVSKYLTFDPSSIEITLEANPDTITREKIRAFNDAGINRISIGVQTLDEDLLKRLGRTHHAKAALDAVNMTAEGGISNISIDLMYDIPGQTFSSWKNTLKQVVSLPITHLSLYNLTIEPNTVFFKYQESLNKLLPDAECSTEMYREAQRILQEHGLQQYEISAFARDNLYSRHNVGYWTGRPFLGFGPSAFSYWNHCRFRSVAHFNRYLKALNEGRSPIDFREELEPQARRRELLAIALRLKAGVDCTVFEAAHGLLDADTYHSLDALVSQKMLERNGSHFALSDLGVLFYDSVATEIV